MFTRVDDVKQAREAAEAEVALQEKLEQERREEELLALEEAAEQERLEALENLQGVDSTLDNEVFEEEEIELEDL